MTLPYRTKPPPPPGPYGQQVTIVLGRKTGKDVIAQGKLLGVYEFADCEGNDYYMPMLEVRK